MVQTDSAEAGGDLDGMKPCGVRSPDGVYACELPRNHAPTIYASHRFEDLTWVIWLDGTTGYSPPPARDIPQLRHCLPCQREWIGPVGGPCSCGGPGRQGPLGWIAPSDDQSGYQASEYGLSFRTTQEAIAAEDKAVRRARLPWWRRWWKP